MTYKKKPFQSTFTKEKIRECFRRVGYVPFTRRCLQNKNIRHELQDGDEEKSKQIAQIVKEYEDVKNKLRSLGFNVDGIFDAEIEVTPVIRREEEEEKQVDALVSKKKAFSASGIFQNVGTMCVTSKAVLLAQRKQLEMIVREQEAKEAKGRIRERKRKSDALDAKRKHIQGQKLKLTELKGALYFCFREIGSQELISQFKTRKEVEERMKKLPRPWWEIVPDKLDENLNRGASSSDSAISDDHLPSHDRGSSDLVGINSDIVDI